MSSDKPVRVLYVMGAARSGSTILDTALGNNKNVESVGELIKLPVNGWRNNEYCACGERVNSCVFWSEILQEWVKSTGISDFEEFASLQHTMAKIWRPFREFEQPDLSSSVFRKFTEQTLALYRVIHEISGKSLIVDSSKSPLQAYLMSLMPGIDLRIIHLIRDPRGVAWSMNKAYKKNEAKGVQSELKPNNTWYTAINWNRINNRCNWVRKQMKSESSIIVNYEDFVSNPGKTLSRVSELVENDFSDVAEILDDHGSLVVGHTVAGNMLRMSGNVKLKIDTEWKQNLSKIDQSFIYLISSRRLQRYKSEG